jgi:hypothetical protein
MTQRHLALIGYGAIAADLIPILYDQPEGGPAKALAAGPASEAG